MCGSVGRKWVWCVEMGGTEEEEVGVWREEGWGAGDQCAVTEAN